MSNQRIYRCAIYTRKSTTDGLEQDFNSLDAQREACEAFIVSQRSQGWKLLPELYDDGGISGGHMQRPSLNQLIQDIKSKRIDVVVVYKVDRLTRSLADFARLVDLFDEHNVSFVSVTQQFNTTSSMGRLTLNVLLSFAQFEREVTAERIRDKIAASKKKGKWMGGSPPLGYDNIEKKIVVNEAEAQTVRQLFEFYLELGNVRDLKERANQLGLVTKRRISVNDRTTGGIPFSRGRLYHLLSNPLYIGKVRHHDKIYDGEHKAIMSQELWSQVQTQLKQNAPDRSLAVNRKSTQLFTGLIFDETGDRLSPVHTNKKGQVYRYYVSNRLVHNKQKDDTGWRLAADKFEQTVFNATANFMANQKELLEALNLENVTTEQVKTILQRTKTLSTMLQSTEPQERKALVSKLFARIDITNTSINIKFNKMQMYEMLSIHDDATNESNTIQIALPLSLKKRGVETRIIIGHTHQQSNPDAKLIDTITQTHYWFSLLKSGKVNSIMQIASKAKKDPGEVSRLLPLAFLAPSIVKSILIGTQPISLTNNELIRLAPTLPLDWKQQQSFLGFDQ